jgi:hypothetical protein
MAKILFNEKTIEKNQISVIALDVDINLFCPPEKLVHYAVVEISDADYHSLFNGSKHINVENGNVTFKDQIFNGTLNTNEESFKHQVNYMKETLSNFKEKYPTHSKMNDVNVCLNFLNNIDYSTLTYPTNAIDKYLSDNNVFISTITLIL